MIKGEIGKFLRIFVFLSLIVLMVINWNWVKGIFDYKAIYGDIADSLRQQFSQKKEIALKVPQVELSESKFTEKPDSVEIPKIEVSAPLIFIESSDNKDITVGLKERSSSLFSVSFTRSKWSNGNLGS